jgi:hypothetical protein
MTTHDDGDADDRRRKGGAEEGNGEMGQGRSIDPGGAQDVSGLQQERVPFYPPEGVCRVGRPSTAWKRISRQSEHRLKLGHVSIRKP